MIFYKNIIYNAADGVYSYEQDGVTTVYDFYMISLPAWNEQHLKKVVTDYISKNNPFNELAQTACESGTIRICISFVRPSLEWPIGKILPSKKAEHLSTTATGHLVATCIAVISKGQPVTNYYYSSNFRSQGELIVI